MPVGQLFPIVFIFFSYRFFNWRGNEFEKNGRNSRNIWITVNLWKLEISCLHFLLSKQISDVSCDSQQIYLNNKMINDLKLFSSKLWSEAQLIADEMMDRNLSDEKRPLRVRMIVIGSWKEVTRTGRYRCRWIMQTLYVVWDVLSSRTIDFSDKETIIPSNLHLWNNVMCDCLIHNDVLPIKFIRISTIFGEQEKDE